MRDSLVSNNVNYNYTDEHCMTYQKCLGVHPSFPYAFFHCTTASFQKFGSACWLRLIKVSHLNCTEIIESFSECLFKISCIFAFLALIVVRPHGNATYSMAQCPPVFREYSCAHTHSVQFYRLVHRSGNPI